LDPSRCSSHFLPHVGPPPFCSRLPYATLFRSEDGDESEGSRDPHDDQSSGGEVRHEEPGDRSEELVERVPFRCAPDQLELLVTADRKSTRLNSSHVKTSYAVFCLKKKNDTSAR